MELTDPYIDAIIKYLRDLIFSEAWRTNQVYAAVSMILLIVWMCIGSLLFLHRKKLRDHNQNFGDGLYFTYVTVSTVGLGDYSYNTHVTECTGIIWTIVGISLFNRFLAVVGEFLDKLEV